MGTRRAGAPLRNQPEERLLFERHARIKRVFVELHDYAFFHNPSEIGEVDDRFVGRSRIAHRLHTLLTSQQTKSGSYLVTGYRGAGKSSLVARVLTSVSSGESRSLRTSRYFRIFFPLPFLALIDVRPFEPGANWLTWSLLALLPFLFFLAVLVYLVARDPDARSLPVESLMGETRRRPRGTRLVNQLGHAFTMDHLDRHPDRRGRTLLQDYLFLSLIQIAALVIFWLHDRGVVVNQRYDVEDRLAVYVGLYLLLVLWIVNKTLRRRARRRQEGQPLPWLRARWSNLRDLAGHAWVRIGNYFNYSHRIHIKVNLGQNDLNEEDILRLIARNIYTKYLEFRRFGWTDVWWRILYALLLYFGVALLYHYGPIYQLNQAARLDSRIYYYFPSQAVPLLSRGAESEGDGGGYGETPVASPRETEGARILDSVLARHLSRAAEEAGSADPGLGRLWSHLDGAVRGQPGAPQNLPTPPVSGESWSLQRTAMTVTTYADLFLYQVYRAVVKNLPWPLDEFPDSEANRVGPILIEHLRGAENELRIIPPFVDYFFLGYLLLGWLLLRTLVRTRPFGVVTHAVILRELRDLNDAMDAQVTHDDSVSATSSPRPFAFLFARRRTKVYPIANVREIEKRLLEILDEIDRVPRLTVRPDFIFIFDELDKIEPHQNVTLAQEDEEAAQTSFLDPGLSSYGAIRERQQRILQLLSNLKHFFTTAKAKFIFIAGREMFDASLADVSDRHFFMGSIFNDVINVPSFLRDPSDDRLADVTSLTESYLCRFLVPHDFPGEPSLHTFDQYLRREVFPEPEGDDAVALAERAWLRQRREKVVHDVFNFIVYLAYRSNGAPKKITRLIEEFVIRPSREELRDPSVLCAGRSSGSLYLHFGFYDQYTFGLIAYLANPLFLSLNRANKDLGDKLLVSTSFLLDHLYKFHGFGFSWRNLELLPEIVDINKAPELRQLISQLLGFLTKTHLQPIVSGLHDFRFRKKITEEISYLSKVSEAESAAFNFTLDESLPIKQYYNRKLHDLLAVYRSYPETAKDARDFVHSLGFVRMILGDLHFFDEEYDHAILHYMEAVQALQHPESLSLRPDRGGGPGPKRGGRPKMAPGDGREPEPRGETAEFEPDVRRLVLLIRNLLKLGLAFEKKKTYDSASLIYGKLTSYVIRFRDIDLAEIGLWAARNAKGEAELHVLDGTPVRGTRRPRPRKDAEFDEMVDELDFTPQIEDLTHKAVVFEGIRLLYQPLLAKLQIVEKASLGGISTWDVRRTFREFEFIVKMLNPKDNFLVLAEFKNKVGDILFYKNGPECVPPRPRRRLARMKTGIDERRHPPTAFCLSEANRGLCRPNENVRKLWDRGCHTPCSACEQYVLSLSEIYEATFGREARRGAGGSLLLRLFDGLRIERNRSQRWSSLRELANSLSDVGDTFLSCCRLRRGGDEERENRRKDEEDGAAGEVLSAEFLEVVLGLVSTDLSQPEEEKLTQPLTKLQEAILCYVLSASFYKLAGEYKSHSHQLTKLLYVIREAVAMLAIDPPLGSRKHPSAVWRKLADRIELDLVPKIIRGIYRTYESAHRLEIEKLKEVLETGDRPRFLEHSVYLNNVSVSRELREVIVILQEIRLSVTWEVPPAHRRFVSPYGLVNSMYNRIHELRYRGKVNFELLERLGVRGRLLRHVEECAVPSYAERRRRQRKLLAKLGGAKVQKVRSLLGLRKERRQVSCQDVLEHLVVDSIFCFHQLLRCLQVFGLSYMANHSMRAAAHEKLAFWCDCYYEYLKLFAPGSSQRKVQERMERQLKDLIGPADLATITPNYHKERALLHYRSALQTHSQGNAYKQMLEEMYYLDDDLNDELTHFCAAIERFRINAGDIQDEIDGLVKRVKLTSLHSARSYLSGPPTDRPETLREPEAAANPSTA